MLTKSNFMKYVECPVYLWLAKHRPELIPENTPEMERRFEMGRKVDDLARKLFTGGVEVKGFNREGWQNTQKLMAGSAKILFQPTVVADPLTCRADILTRKGKASGWDINEVKMAASVKREYPYDVAFQRICFENAGIEIARANLIHINTKYIRKGEIEPEKLFVSENITDEVNGKTSKTKELIEKALRVAERREAPDAAFLQSCPRPRTCEYLQYYLNSIGHKPEIPPKIAPKINIPAIRNELKQLKYPLYFFDYETYSSAIPAFDGTRPYQNVPFQYSLLVKEKPTAAIRHTEFLARAFENPVPALLAQLKLDIVSRGSVIVWFASFEKGCNDEMARMEPSYADFLQSVNDRIFDLMLIFKHKRELYIKSEFQKSASLKKVLPVMCPELSYESLVIQEGQEASASWPILTSDKTPESEKAKLAKDMLKYCRRDTEAMVCILEKLTEEIK